jgi:hypothetical protein
MKEERLKREQEEREQREKELQEIEEAKKRELKVCFLFLIFKCGSQEYVLLKKI